MISVKFKRADDNQDLALPTHATAGAAGFDFQACLPEGPVTLAPGAWGMIPTGFHVELPVGYEMQVRPRSGLAAKCGVTVLNSPGTVDHDYRGPVKVILINHSKFDFAINHGDRIAQGVIAAVPVLLFEEVQDLSDTERGEGGFGSTGVAHRG